MVNGLEYYIKVGLKQFSKHEVGIYEDETYYLPKGKNLSSQYKIK